MNFISQRSQAASGRWFGVLAQMFLNSIFNSSDSVGVLLNESYLFVCLAIFLEPAAHVRAALYSAVCELKVEKKTLKANNIYMISVIYRRLTDICQSSAILFLPKILCSKFVYLFRQQFAIKKRIQNEIAQSSRDQFYNLFKFIRIANDPTSSYLRQDKTKTHTVCVMFRGDVNTIRLQNLF